MTAKHPSLENLLGYSDLTVDMKKTMWKRAFQDITVSSLLWEHGNLFIFISQ